MDNKTPWLVDARLVKGVNSLAQVTKRYLCLFGLLGENMFDEKDGVTHRLKDLATPIFEFCRVLLALFLLIVVGIPLFFATMLGIKLIIAMFF